MNKMWKAIKSQADENYMKIEKKQQRKLKSSFGASFNLFIMTSDGSVFIEQNWWQTKRKKK